MLLVFSAPPPAPPPLPQFKGNVARYAASHTTSRVLQAAVKAAPPAARAAVAAEVGDDLLTLSKSSYGHFLVRKLVALAPKEDVPGERGERRMRGANKEGGGADVKDGITNQITALSFQRARASPPVPVLGQAGACSAAETRNGPETPRTHTTMAEK